MDKPTSKPIEVDAESIRWLVTYLPESGEIIWNERPASAFANKAYANKWNSRYSGKTAGSLKEGYINLSIGRRNYPAHRIAWLCHYGEWPAHDIDHINGCKSDNRIENLRDVTKTENNRNTPLRKNNSSGFVGVYWDKVSSKWSAKIGIGGKLKNIGFYKTIEEAIEARKEFSVALGYHENHGRLA